MLFEETLIETIVFVLLVVLVWTMYAYYVYFQARQANPNSLSYNLRRQRESWVRRILLRDNRTSDASFLAGMERVSTFFATSTLLILATLITAINSGADLPIFARQLFGDATGVAQEAREHKSILTLFSMCFLFLFAFFKFTWSIRQYGFISVLLGNAPMPHELHDKEECERFVFYVAQLVDHAGHNSNSGLRAYYFSLPLLAHILSPAVGVLCLFVVLLILYDRELNSSTIDCIRKSNVSCNDSSMKPPDHDRRSAGMD